MPSFVLPPGQTPLPISDDFIVSNDKAVLFMNFAVGSSTLQQEHKDFIRTLYIPFLISQIDKAGFSDKVSTIRPVGKASATGTAAKNLTLSAARAAAIGNFAKAQFDAQKATGKTTKDMTMVVDPIAEGDSDERSILGPGVGHMNQNLVEKNSKQFRAVLLSFQVNHVVVDDDTKIFCRQILNAKLEVKQVPANHLDEVLQQMPPELRFAVSQFFSAITGAVKAVLSELTTVEEFLEVGAPEVFLFFKLIDFIVPKSVTLLFEFKDARGRTKKYNFTGDANKVDLDAIDAFCQILSIFKWLNQVPAELDEAEKLVSRQKLTNDQIDALKKAIGQAKGIVGKAQSIFTALTGKGSLFRKAFGDEFADNLIEAVNIAKANFLPDAQTASPFAPVTFDLPGLFDIFSFGNMVARTTTTQAFLHGTTVNLDFAAPANQPLLGFQAHSVIHRDFELSLTLVSFELVSSGLFIGSRAA